MRHACMSVNTENDNSTIYKDSNGIIENGDDYDSWNNFCNGLTNLTLRLLLYYWLLFIQFNSHTLFHVTPLFTWHVFVSFKSGFFCFLPLLTSIIWSSLSFGRCVSVNHIHHHNCICSSTGVIIVLYPLIYLYSYSFINVISSLPTFFQTSQRWGTAAWH